VERSLARSAPPPPGAGSRFESLAARTTLVTGVSIVLAMLVIYTISNPLRLNNYNHFVWQASAWLEGEAGIRYPVTPDDGLGAHNEFFQDVLVLTDDDGFATGRALIPFPPLPAVVLLPFVAVFGLATNESLIATVLGALVVGLAFWMLGRLPVRPTVRIATTVAFGLGTVFWYASELGSTWYLAHVVAVGLTLLSIAIALDADPLAAAGGLDGDAALAVAEERARSGADGRTDRWLTGLLAAVRLDRRQVLAGFLLGLAATARLTVIFGLPFLVFVGGGGTWRRRGLSAAVGAAIPVLGLGLYNIATTGHLFHPAYEHLYQVEIGFYPGLYPYLQYHADWALEDPRYIPQNLALLLAGLPEILPPCPTVDAVRGWFDAACPYIRPRADGMSLLLVSPIVLVALPALGALRRSRLVAGAALATVVVAIANLMHFSQGWVQFGYRFSNDFIPFVLLLLALGMERLGGARWFVALLLLVSILVNLWGIGWSRVLGW
jgi:hypothetical protein